MEEEIALNFKEEIRKIGTDFVFGKDSKDVENAIDLLIERELADANMKNPLFCNMHECSAVLLEEIEEAEDDLKYIKELYQIFWNDVKTDNRSEYGFRLQAIKERTINLIKEAIQVAAMAEKGILSDKKQRDADFETYRREF